MTGVPRPTSTTVVLAVVAAVSTTWAHLDARRGEGERATLVSTRSAAWRVLPELAHLGATGATVELWPSRGDPVRLVPGPVPGGHQVWVGDQVLGPADPEAIEGVWDSLRMATTVRAASEAQDPGLGDGGRIVVTLPEPVGVRTLVLGRPTVDETGIYGVVEGGAEGTEGLWVLEREMSALVQQAPEAWLARRAVVAEPAQVSRVLEGELTVERGLDDLWRARVADGPAAILDRVAVRTRLDRLVSARLDPLVTARPDDPGEPWITLEGSDGVDWSLRRHGPCPGRPQRVLVDRGPGRWGCIDAAVTAPWPVPGRAGGRQGHQGESPGALLDPRLLPHAYGRVLRIEQRVPQARVLQRHGGGWRIEESKGDRETQLSVDEPEVFAWYDALHDAEVTLEAVAEDAPAPEWSTPDVELLVVTDSTATLRLRCILGPPMRCRRDDGPVLHVRRPPPALAFDADTFAERRLTALRSEDVRAIEILAGPADPQVLRQSAHFDLGVWRMDAPVHPEGDAALDGMALERLLGVLGGLRAQAWVDDAADVAARRRIRVERVPRRGQDPVLEIDVLPDCVVRVTGHRPARLPEGPCETLGQDLLVQWPLQRLLDLARGLELSRGGETIALSRKGDAWARLDGGPAPEVSAWLDRMHARTASGVRRAEPPVSVAWRLRVLPGQGTAFVVDGGRGWVRFEGEDWHYRLDEGSGPDEPAGPDELDDR
ncbi:MAG: hypothetical protein AAGF11_51280 [Myxococcota bacterium]